MRITSLITATALSLISVTAAQAYTVDDNSMGTPTANAKFSDPDEKTPIGTFQVQPGYTEQSPDSPGALSYPPSSSTRAPSFTPLDISPRQ